MLRSASRRPCCVGWRGLWLSGLILTLIAGLLTAQSVVGRDDQAVAYVPSLAEMMDLLGANLPGYLIEPSTAPGETWDVAAGYVLTVADGGARYELFIAARVLSSRAEATDFFRDRAAELAVGNERTVVSADSADAARYGLDDLRGYRLILRSPASGQRVSTYTRLARLGRTVTMIQAIGDPGADDAGYVANDRALALVRTFELVLGRMHWYPSDAARDVPGLEPFARGWSRHGFSIGIDPTGHGEVSWRVYRWCEDDPTPPCDEMIGNQIRDGGWASVLFYHVEGQTAEGVVIGSAVPDVLALGPATVTLQPYGMAKLEQAGRDVVLCGPNYFELAPESVRRQAPCGA